MKPSRPHAVVLGLSPTGLYVARELGRSGTPLLGVDRQFSSAGVSRYFRSSGGVWYEPDTARLADRLLAYARRLDTKPVLIPTSDHYIEFVVENYSWLESVFCLTPGYQSVAADLLDKHKFHHLCAQHGMATPAVWQLSTAQEISRLEGIPFPCLLKPTLIHLAKPYMRGKKVFVVHSLGDLRALSKQLPEEAGSWLLQEIIPGEESRIALVAGYASEHDVAEDTFTARKLRQYPPGFGSASKVISEPCEEARALSLQFIASIGFRGVYGAEFKRDPRDGRLKVIEINPRPTLWFSLSHAAGTRLVERAYCDLAGLPIPEDNEQLNGVLWHYALKDFVSAMFYRFRGRGFIFDPPDLSAGGPVRSRCWPVFSFTDPAPLFAELYVYVSKYFRRLF